LTRSRRHFGSALSVALVAVLVLAAAPRRAAGATDTRVRLEYQADEQGGCVGADELRRRVTDQLGHDPFRSDADQRVAISIAKTETGFQGRIVWTEADGRQVGERLLSSRSRDCREIAANVAFAVALQLQLVEHGTSDDADAAAPTVEGAVSGPTGQPERVSEIPERPRVPAETPGGADGQESAASRLQLAVGAGPAVGIGMTPDATAFGRLFVVARVRRLSAEIAADAALPSTQGEPDGTGVVVNALGSSAAGCAHLAIASACLLGRLGWLRAHGTGIAVPRTSWGLFGELGMRVAGTRELGRFIVSVHADGLVMLSRWNVVLNDAVVWTVPRVGGVVGVDVALRFF
jgi:hypothetical protein